MMFAKTLIISTFLLASACSKKSSSSDDTPSLTSTGPLSGKINGQDWTYKTAILAQSAPGSDVYYLTITDTESSNPCMVNMAMPNRCSIMASLTLKTGEVNFADKTKIKTLTMVSQRTSPPTNFMTSNAKLSIDSISDTQATGTLSSTFGKNTSVAGIFTATLCKSKPVN